MAEEMIAEDWESVEAMDGESEEAIAESEDSVEDIGERARRKRNRYRPSRGVQGIVVRGQDGSPKKLPFPAKLATAEETNRGLASQEAGRRALDERLDKLERRFRLGQKNDAAASGLVSLVIGVPLTTFGAFQAAQQTGGTFLGNFAQQTSAQMATLISVTQVATSGAKLLINRRYHGSGIGIAADIFAAAEIVTFTVGSLFKPKPLNSVANREEALRRMTNSSNGTLFLTEDTNEVYRVVVDVGNKPQLLLVR